MKSKIKGFTMIEAVLALVIVSFCLVTQSVLMAPLKSIGRLKNESNEILYSYVQLDQFLKKKGPFELDHEQSTDKEVHLIPVTASKDDAVKVDEKAKSYRIQKYGDMIRLTGDTQGHMPLFVGIKDAVFVVHENQLTILITEKDNRKTQWHYELSSKGQKAQLEEHQSSKKELSNEKINSSKVQKEIAPSSDR